MQPKSLRASLTVLILAVAILVAGIIVPLACMKATGGKPAPAPESPAGAKAAADKPAGKTDDAKQVAADQAAELIVQLGAKESRQRDGAQQKLLALALTADIYELLKKHADDPDPEVRTRVRKVLEAEWGEAVEGVQVRLRAEKTQWKAGETPRLIASIRNIGELSFVFGPGPSNWEFQVDGRWYNWLGEVFKNPQYPLSPNGEFRDIAAFTFDVFWSPKDGGEPLTLTQGRHTVRVAALCRSAGGKGADARPVSNAVEIEHIPRTQNAEADKLSKKAVEKARAVDAAIPPEARKKPRTKTFRLK